MKTKQHLFNGYSVATPDMTFEKLYYYINDLIVKKGNIRDYASINELICLSNMQNINAVLIEDGLNQKERLYPSGSSIAKAFQSVYRFPYILCYNVLCDFVSLIFALIKVRNALWEDIIQGKL